MMERVKKKKKIQMTLRERLSAPSVRSYKNFFRCFFLATFYSKVLFFFVLKKNNRMKINKWQGKFDQSWNVNFLAFEIRKWLKMWNRMRLCSLYRTSIGCAFWKENVNRLTHMPMKPTRVFSRLERVLYIFHGIV